MRTLATKIAYMLQGKNSLWMPPRRFRHKIAQRHFFNKMSKRKFDRLYESGKLPKSYY